MRAGLVSAIVTAACLLSTGASPALAAVDLVFRPEPQTVPVGARIALGLYAVSDDDTDQPFSAIDAGFTWDPTVVQLMDANAGAHPWSMSGFLSDSALDGVNDSLTDGDGRYTALSFTPALATPDGFLVATFWFDAVAASELAEVVIEPSLGEYSATRVFGTGGANEDVTGTLGAAGLTLLSDASLSVADMTIPAGRDALIVVSGEIVDRETFGVTIAVELVPRDGTTGTIVFTPAPPVDVVQLDSPWLSGGMFFVVDSEPQPIGTGSPTRNGSVDGNWSGHPEPVTFAGDLAGFPITPSGDARGVWDVRLAYDDGLSSWEGLMTGMYHGVLRVVEEGDGDGDESIDARDFSELQACFTGATEPADPPAYSQAPALRCNVYDFDGDGDIDADDYAEFHAVMSGPVP